MIATMYSAVIAASLACLLGLVQGQQVYVPTLGAMTRPQCLSSASATPKPTPSCSASEPNYRFSHFSFTMTETVRTATSVKPATHMKTYAPDYSDVSHLIPDLSTTTWTSFNPNASVPASDKTNPYGTAAWSAMWQRANLTNFTATGMYTTTVRPTAVPTPELVLPPQDYFGPTDCYNFPKDFIFGVAGSAVQIEGAIAMEGRGPSLFEVLTTGSQARDYVTNENYYLYKQDIERLASMGVKYYSFSIAWPRILPFGLPGTPVNKQGIDHYDDLINYVIAKGMIPVATILHFDTPLQLYPNVSAVHDNEHIIGYQNGGYQYDNWQDAFVNYGKIVMAHFADRVPVWLSINEPLLYSTNGKAIHNVIFGHSRLWHFYHHELKATGKLGLKFNNNFGFPKNPEDPNDSHAADWFNSFQVATFANPIFLGKDYPKSYKKTVKDHVPLSKADLAYLKGSSDFFGIDPYTATVVTPPNNTIFGCARNSSDPNWPYCVNQTSITSNGWNTGYRSQSYVYITPKYLRSALNYYYNTFRKPVLISEFGFPVFGEAEKLALEDQLFDTPRSIYYLSYMSETLKAIWEDGVEVMGALAWSFADNWEFGDYNQQFGLQVVNRTTQERYYKKSFFDLVDFVNTRMPNKS